MNTLLAVLIAIAPVAQMGGEGSFDTTIVNTTATTVTGSAVGTAVGTCIDGATMYDVDGVTSCGLGADTAPETRYLQPGQDAWEFASVNTTGAPTVLAGGLGTHQLGTIVAANCGAGVDTITYTVNGTPYVRTAGTSWAVGTDAATCTNIAADAAANVPGLTGTTCVGGVVGLAADRTVTSLSVDSSDDTCALEFNGVDGSAYLEGGLRLRGSRLRLAPGSSTSSWSIQNMSQTEGGVVSATMGNVDSAGIVINGGGRLVAPRLYWSVGALCLDDAACVASTHALGAGDVQVGQALEVDGNLYADGDVRMATTGKLYLNASSAANTYLWSAGGDFTAALVVAGSSGPIWRNTGTQYPNSYELQLGGTGGDGEYRLVYENLAARAEFVSTDVDGAGTNGVVWSVDNGTDDINLPNLNQRLYFGTTAAGAYIDNAGVDGRWRVTAGAGSSVQLTNAQLILSPGIEVVTGKPFRSSSFVYNSGGTLCLDDAACVASTHALGAGDLQVGQSLEVDGTIYADGGVQYGAGAQVLAGTSSDSVLLQQSDDANDQVCLKTNSDTLNVYQGNCTTYATTITGAFTSLSTISANSNITAQSSSGGFFGGASQDTTPTSGEYIVRLNGAGYNNTPTYQSALGFLALEHRDPTAGDVDTAWVFYPFDNDVATEYLRLDATDGVEAVVASKPIHMANGEYIDNSVDGTIALGGAGGVNNEDLLIGFETAGANVLNFASTTGVHTANWAMGLQTTSFVSAGTNQRIGWTSRSELYSPADGQLRVTNDAATSGVVFDVDDTANTLTLKDLAGTGSGGLQFGTGAQLLAGTTTDAILLQQSDDPTDNVCIKTIADSLRIFNGTCASYATVWGADVVATSSFISYGLTTGGNIQLYDTDTTPVNSQIAGTTTWKGYTDTGVYSEYARQRVTLAEVTNGDIDGSMQFSVVDNNSLTEYLRLDATNGVEAVVASKPIQLADGTVGAPAYSFTSNPDTGIYVNGSNVIVAVDGVAKLNIGSNPVTVTTTLGLSGQYLTGARFLSQTPTSPKNFNVTESGQIWTNDGVTSEQVYNLPVTTSPGYSFEFVSVDADGIQVNANTGQYIYLGTTSSALAGCISTTEVGAAARCRKMTIDTYFCAAVSGTWSVDVGC